MSEDKHGWWVRWVPLMINAGALIWGAATLSADLRHLSTQVAEIRNGSASKAEVNATAALLRQEDALRDERLAEVRARITALEVRLNGKL